MIVLIVSLAAVACTVGGFAIGWWLGGIFPAEPGPRSRHAFDQEVADAPA